MSHSSGLCGVQAHDLGDHTVIRFTGPRVLLDEDNTCLVGEELLSLAGRLKPIRLLVDFGNVAYLTTAALGLLLQLRKALSGWGGGLTLRHLHPRLHEVFEVTRLHTLFDIQGEAGGSGAGSGVGP
jgi:anti-sigma B factor antagonist